MIECSLARFLYCLIALFIIVFICDFVVLQRHYSVIESLACNDSGASVDNASKVNQCPDFTLPDIEGMEKVNSNINRE